MGAETKGGSMKYLGVGLIWLAWVALVLGLALIKASHPGFSLEGGEIFGISFASLAGGTLITYVMLKGRSPF